MAESLNRCCFRPRLPGALSVRRRPFRLAAISLGRAAFLGECGLRPAPRDAPAAVLCGGQPPQPSPRRNYRTAQRHLRPGNELVHWGGFPAGRSSLQGRNTDAGVCRSIETRAKPGATRRGKAGPESGERKVGKASPSIPLRFNNGSIETAAGLQILANLEAGFSMARGAETDGPSEALLLGFSSSEKSNFIETAIGELRCSRLLSCGRCKLWWMTPEWGNKAKDIPPETQFLLTEIEEGGPYALILPLISEGQFRGSLRPPRAGQNPDTLHLRMESNSPSVETADLKHTLVVQASWDLFALVEQGVTLAASLSGGSPPLAQKELPGSLDVFGWCTWDAFYSKVSAFGIREGLASLVSGGAPPRLLVIDDGWQQTDVDPEYRAMFGEENIIVEEVWEAERYALSTGGMDDLAEQGGTSIYSLTATVTASVEEEKEERKKMMEAYYREGADMGKDLSRSRDPKGLTALFGWAKRGLWTAVDFSIGWFLGLGEALFIRFYQRVIDPAPPGSTRVKFFTWLANGPLRMGMLQFFCASGDFSKRLVDVTANSKFADPYSGPNSKGVGSNLGLVVQSLREDYGVEYVYCWHGLPGYWGGISPHSPAMKRFNPRLMTGEPMPGVVEVEPAQAWGPCALAGLGVVEDPTALYHAMHAYLAEQGIDGVKVDCQAGIGLVPCSSGSPAKSAVYHQALEDSVQTHFPGNHLINCMCHDTENFYRFTNSAVARACDDFYPRDKASHTAHISNAAYNALFLSALVLPDWDMFQSKHPANLLHAAARAVSGAAIYVSDKPGQHDFTLLRRLVLPDGSVLRANLPGRPTSDTVFTDVMRDGKSLMKVWNENNFSGIVGVFNVQGSSWDRTKRKFHTHDSSPPALECTVSPLDVGGSGVRAEEGSFRGVAFCSNSRHVYRLNGEGAVIPMKLSAGGCEVITFVPFETCGGVEVAPIGLSDMLNPGGAVLTVSSQAASCGPEFTVGFRGCGRFTAASSSKPAACKLRPGTPAKDGEGGEAWKEVAFTFHEDIGTVEVELPQLKGLRGELLISFSEANTNA